MPDAPTTTVRAESVTGYAEDKALRAMVDRLMTRVVELESAVLYPLGPGETLSSVGTRARQTSFGSLVCSRTRDALRADACLINGGGIRANREYTRHVAFGDIEAELPFDNEMVVVRLPGRVVQDAVRASRASAPGESGGFLQVDDRLLVGPQGNVLEIAGESLELDRDYAVAMVRAFLTGMDHIEPLVDFGRAHPERVPPPGSGRELKQILVDALSIALWKRLGTFEAIDANHDGELSESEIRDAVARATGETASPITVALAMGAVDPKHTHAITRTVVAEAMTPTAGPTTGDKGYAAPMTEPQKPPGLPAIDVREYGGKKDGERQSMDRRLFMQLLVFDVATERPADATAEDLGRLLCDRHIPGVVYADAQSPRGIGLLTWSDDPAHFVRRVRPLFGTPQLDGVNMRPGWAMIGRTYGQGHEPDLEHVLLHRPVEQVTREAWPWHVWYPLRRSGAFAKLPTEEVVPMMREHAQIGMAYGQAELGHDVRLACHGLDAEDNEFVIGLVGKDLYPLSHLVQAMRKTRQTSEFIVKMGPFFVGYALHRSSG
jgi:chlorite dismutase